MIRVGKSKTIHFLNKAILLKHGKGIVQLKQSYDIMWEKILGREDQDEHTVLGCFSDWDNSPRKSYNAIIMTGASPEKFRKYFTRLLQKAKEIKSPMIVINAWNEWAEGAYLEPDERYRYGYLEAIKTAKEEVLSAD